MATLTLTRSQRAWRWLFFAGILPLGGGLYFLGCYLTHRTGVEDWRTTGNAISLATMAIFLFAMDLAKELFVDDDWWKWLLGSLAIVGTIAVALRFILPLLLTF